VGAHPAALRFGTSEANGSSLAPKVLWGWFIWLFVLYIVVFIYILKQHGMCQTQQKGK
jgi:hypothetical protein